MNRGPPVSDGVRTIRTGVPTEGASDLAGERRPSSPARRREGIPELLRYAASERHALVNHIQVVTGWLQLERAERARSYLDDLRRRLTAESELVRSCAPRGATLFLLWAGLAESLGLVLRHRAQPGLREFSWPRSLHPHVAGVGTRFLLAAAREAGTREVGIAIEQVGTRRALSLSLPLLGSDWGERGLAERIASVDPGPAQGWLRLPRTRPERLLARWEAAIEEGATGPEARLELDWRVPPAPVPAGMPGSGPRHPAG